jgi:hypothetical protein
MDKVVVREVKEKRKERKEKKLKIVVDVGFATNRTTQKIVEKWAKTQFVAT